MEAHERASGLSGEEDRRGGGRGGAGLAVLAVLAALAARRRGQPRSRWPDRLQERHRIESRHAPGLWWRRGARQRGQSPSVRRLKRSTAASCREPRGMGLATLSSRRPGSPSRRGRRRNFGVCHAASSQAEDAVSRADTPKNSSVPRREDGSMTMDRSRGADRAGRAAAAGGADPIAGEAGPRGRDVSSKLGEEAWRGAGTLKETVRGWRPRGVAMKAAAVRRMPHRGASVEEHSRSEQGKIEGVLGIFWVIFGSRWKAN